MVEKQKKKGPRVKTQGAKGGPSHAPEDERAVSSHNSKKMIQSWKCQHAIGRRSSKRRSSSARNARVVKVRAQKRAVGEMCKLWR